MDVYTLILYSVILFIAIIVYYLIYKLNCIYKTKPRPQKQLASLKSYNNSNFKSEKESSSRSTLTPGVEPFFDNKGDSKVMKGNSLPLPEENDLKGGADFKLKNSQEAVIHRPFDSSNPQASGSGSSLSITPTNVVNSANNNIIKQEEKQKHFKGLWSDRIKEKSEFVIQENKPNTSSVGTNPDVKELKFKKPFAVVPKKTSLFEKVKSPIKETVKSEYSINKEMLTYRSATPKESELKSVIEKKENLSSKIADSNANTPECFVTSDTNKQTMPYTDKHNLQAKFVTSNISDSKNYKSNNESSYALVTRSTALKSVHAINKNDLTPTKVDKIGLIKPEVQLTVEGFMDTDDDKENTIVSRGKDLISQMDEDTDDLNMNDGTYEMDSTDDSMLLSQKNNIHIHHMDVEYTNKNKKKYMKLNEENMNCETEDINEIESMSTDANKAELNNDVDWLMTDESHSHISKGNNVYLERTAVKNITPKSIENLTGKIKTNEKELLIPTSNILSTTTQSAFMPAVSDSSLYYRKTLHRTTINSEHKKFVPGQIAVSVIPSGHQDNKPMVGVKLRRSVINSQLSSKLEENSGIKEELLLTIDSCQKKEKKRMMEIPENPKAESDEDSRMIKIKKSQKDLNPPKNHLAKRRERWCLSKTLMKKKNTEFKVEKPMTSDFISDMDVNNVEVSGIDCDICSRRFPYLECTWCPNNDRICLNCIREVIRDTMDKRKLHLSCPVESCKASIDLDLLSKKVDPVTVELLGRKLRKWLERAHMAELERLFGKVSCPQCHTQSILDKEEIHFICNSCRLELCSCCQQLWSSCVNHNECRLLNYSGQKCFKDSQDLPANWDKTEAGLSNNNETIIDVEEQINVSLQSSEGKTVIKLFCETLRGTRVTAITRIQNIKLWEKYVLKRKHMIDEIGLSKIKERALFHGTEASNIPLICNEGFDMRVKTVNGAVYGKGIYFSTQSHYSKRYAGSTNQMFLARVLCGYSTQGSQVMTRPPKHEGTGRMYDSCVNDTNNPTIYVFFENAQCYPAYIISYK